MWDFFETVRHRHSVRCYQSDMPIEDEKLHAILESACAAPSAGDLQAYHISVVRDPESRKILSEAADGQDFIAQAPVALVFFSDCRRSENQFGDRGRSLYAIQDATIAAAYAQLAVCAAGLGSTWIGYFNAEKVRQLAKVDESYKAVAILSVGYPAELPAATPRRPISEIVSYTD